MIVESEIAFPSAIAEGNAIGPRKLTCRRSTPRRFLATENIINFGLQPLNCDGDLSEHMTKEQTCVIVEFNVV